MNLKVNNRKYCEPSDETPGIFVKRQGPSGDSISDITNFSMDISKPSAVNKDELASRLPR